jgi:hypothetical protein
MAIKFCGVAIWVSPPVRGAPRDRRGVIQSPESKEIFFPARRTPGLKGPGAAISSMLKRKLPPITKNRNEEGRMVCKHSALFAVVIASALAGFGGAALAADKADTGGWAAPNVPGMPGYKEPPKGPDEPKKPIPVPPADPNSASYLQHMGAEPAKK